MILHPGIMALVLTSFLMSLMTLYASSFAVQILLCWDIASGSELQLALERRTYLISTVISYFLAFQLLSLFLFIHTADSICHLFVGSMCAVGTISVNNFGYPTLLLKVATFILAGLWLILNYADNRAFDYPLIRAKYLLLLIMTPIVLAETVMQGIYFLGLRPDIITSCCGSLFSQGSSVTASEILAMPVMPMKVIFYTSMMATFASGARCLLRNTGGYLFALMSGVTSLIAIVSIISFISLYIYEMPAHHCPFCILQKEYGYVGYLLYTLLLLGTVTGLGVGLLQLFRHKESIEKIILTAQWQLVAVSCISFFIFMVTVTLQMLFSNLLLTG